MTTAAIASKNWARERNLWKEYYANNIAHQVDATLIFFTENKRTPEKLNRHFDSFLTLFEQATGHPKSSVRQKTIELARTLHPLPIWWGKSSTWLRVLQETARIAQEEGLHANLAWACLTQANILLVSTDANKALSLAERALHVAQKNRDTESIFRAEMMIFEAQKHLGKISDRMLAIQVLEKSLAHKKASIQADKVKKMEIELLIKKGDILQRQGDTKEALLMSQQAYRISQKINGEKDLLIAHLHTRLGANYWAQNKQNLAINQFKKALEIFEYWGDQTSQIDCIGDIGLSYWSAGKYNHAEKTYQTGIRMAEDAKALKWQIIQTGDLGLVHFMKGDVEQALSLMQRQYTLSEATNNHSELQRANGNIGYIQIFKGDFENAITRLERTLTYAKDMKLIISCGTINANLAWAYDELGEKAKALTYAEKSLAIAKEVNAPLLEIIALRSISELQKDPTQRAAYAEKALALAKEHKRRFNTAGALLTLADCYQDEGLYIEAMQLLQELKAEKWLSSHPVFSSLRLPILYWG